MSEPEHFPGPDPVTPVQGSPALDPPAGHLDPGDDLVMTRSEEQLRPGTETYAVGRARLRKVVVTEERTITVVLRHEEFVLDREPIADGTPLAQPTDGTAAGPPPGDVDTVELILYAERPLITTEIVPVERIRLSKNTVTTEQTLTGAVRREVIDYDPPQ
jgi:uncharacterized protein (TIGR02271 family)